MSWLSRSSVILVTACASWLCSCADQERLTIYRAEKMLFQADRMRGQLSNTMVPARSEFLEQTIGAYGNIVTRFRAYVDEDGLEIIVLTAQLSLAQLELETGRIAEARDDFLRILEIERSIPDARMEALFSAAQISERINEPQRAFELYEQFYGEYLSLETAEVTAQKRPAYLETPLKLAGLCGRIERQNEEALWLQTAETLYEHLISTQPGPEVLRAARFRLLATLLDAAKWDRALELSRTMTTIYREDESRTALLLIEARVHQTGKRDWRTAEDLYRHIYEQYPASSQAPDAMLAHAALAAGQTDTSTAVRLYNRALREYANQPEVAARAEWELAVMDEASGDWVDASLRYKSISKRYPGTQPAFDAPLRLAAGFISLGANDAAAGAYTRAVEEYRAVADGQHPILARLTAEEYILQVFTIQQRWADAIRHLIEVAERYPSFERMQHNYITAAEIYRNELGDEQRAAETLIACIERFPDSSAALEAQQRLGPLHPEPGANAVQ